MKKLILLLFSLSISYFSFSQCLSGNYTLDASLPAGSGNYQSFTALATDLNTIGVCGAVTITVAPDTLYESFYLNQIPGASAINTITIDGQDSSTTRLSHDASVDFATITFDGTDYVTIKNLEVEASGITGAVILLANGSNHNLITNNLLKANNTSTNSSLHNIVFSGNATRYAASADANYNTIINNRIDGGYYGIRAQAATSKVNVNNKILSNHIDNVYFYGIAAYYQDSLEIMGNRIDASARNVNSRGIYLYYSNNTLLTENYIKSNNVCLYYNNLNARNYSTPKRKVRIINNMIISTNSYGAQLIYPDSMDIIHNSISTNDLSSSAVVLNGGTSFAISNLDLRNNIFSADHGKAIETNVPESIFDNFDYNIFHSKGHTLLNINGTDFANLDDYGTSSTFNTNSIAGEPQFVSVDNDLHIIGSIASGAGDASVAINFDIDGDPRPLAGVNVDIGADEFPVSGCFPLHDLTAYNPTLDSITLEWKGGTSAEYQLEVVKKDSIRGSGDTLFSFLDTIRIGGLDSASGYEYYIRQICNRGDTSIWWGPFEFYTAYPISYLEDFESMNVGEMTNGWTNTVYTQLWLADTSSSSGPLEDHTIGAGGKFALLNGGNALAVRGASVSSALISPWIFVGANSHFEFSFWYHMFKASPLTDTTSLHVIVEQRNGSSTEIFSVSSAQQLARTDPWRNFSTYLSGYQGEYIQLRFVSNKSQMAIDDVSLDIISPFDVGIVELLEPTGQICTAPFTPVVGVRNMGTTTIDSVKVLWEINGVLTDSIMYATSILPGDTAAVSLGNITFNSSTLYDLKFYTKDPNSSRDSVSSNDTLTILNMRTGLSGNYSINPGLPSTATNFQNFSSLIDILNSYGACGPVNIAIAAGTYDETVHLQEISGASAVNRITFDGGDSSMVILQNDGSGNFATWTFDGADYVTVKNMTIKANESTPGATVLFANGANYNEVSNNELIADTVNTVSTYINVVFSGSITSGTTAGSDANYNTISNNMMLGGYNAVRIYAINSKFNTSNRILNNGMSMIYNCGVYAYYQDSLEIIGNRMEVAKRSTNGDGMVIFYNNNTLINSNFVEAADQGVYFYNQNVNTYSTANRKFEINNNMIISHSDFGIRLYYVDDVDVIHNSISILSGNFPALHIYTTGGHVISNYDVRNNILSAAGGVALETNVPSTVFTQLDHNLYFSNGSDLLTMYSVDYADLPSYQLVDPLLNVNSIVGDPEFKSTSDLHIVGSFVNDKGDNTTGITVDIDGDLRPYPTSTSVDIGADEYNPPPYADLHLEALINPQSISDSCYTSSQDVDLLIRNIGTMEIDFSVDSMDLFVNITGAISQNLTDRINDNSLNNGLIFKNGDSIIVQLGTIDMTNVGIYNFEAYLSLGVDTLNANDSLYSSISNIAAAGTISGLDTVCGSAFVDLNLSGSKGEIQWQRLVGGVFTEELAADSTSYKVFVDSTVTFRAVACGTEFSDTITIVSLKIPAAPMATGDSISLYCGVSGNAVLRVNSLSLGKTYVWYDALIGGNVVGRADTLTRSYASASVNTADTFYVAESNFGCEGARTMVVAVVTVLKPSAPSTTNDTINVMCGISGDAILTASSTSSTASFNWYDNAAAGSLIASDDSLFHSFSSSTTDPAVSYADTFYVAEVILGCEGPRSMAIAIINIEKPAAPNAIGDTSIVLCGDSGTAVLSASSLNSSDRFAWYDTEVAGIMLSTADTFYFGMSTVMQASTTFYTDTFYVAAIDSASLCESERTLVSGTVVCTVGEEEMSSGFSGISIHPNPSKGVFNIHGSNLTGELIITLYNSNGKLVHHQINVENDFMETVDLSSLSKGMYFIKLQSGESMEMRKLIIQ